MKEQEKAAAYIHEESDLRAREACEDMLGFLETKRMERIGPVRGYIAIVERRMRQFQAQVAKDKEIIDDALSRAEHYLNNSMRQVNRIVSLGDEVGELEEKLLTARLFGFVAASLALVGWLT